MAKTTCNFFALLQDGTIRKIALSQELTPVIKKTFLVHGEWMISADRTPVKFDGNFTPQDDDILYVDFALPKEFLDAGKNHSGTRDLVVGKDSIKSLFWYENDAFFFQNFDNRKLLENKNVIYFDKNVFNKLEENAFIIDETVHAVYDDKKLFFRSYANANKIFSLLEYFQAATDDDLRAFAMAVNIHVDNDWLLTNANVILRKQITLLTKSKVLDFISPKKVVRSAKAFNLVIELESGKIKFPSNVKDCRNLLNYLNEQYYSGLITGKKYMTNSKRAIDGL